ncbi:glycosyltransferase family 25 protein [Microbulbifer elongatus]|uniref:glycosyltransferase family 25 protein n=1 Tax=Microbulbifer elongatus TaxID=86173 RepID=UPI001CFD2344|nr:glycosyltransferase family 25 protein [Microbulbifer elongatus]
MKLGCWVISLNEQDPQTQELLSSLKSHGLDPKLSPAVDGRKMMPSLQGDEFLDESEAKIRHKRSLTSSELGCYLSHYRTIKLAYDHGYDRACIMEDDVLLEPDFGTCLKKLLDLPDEYEMIRLMALKIRKRKIVAPLFEDRQHLHEIVRPERGWCGTQGYVLSRPGMKKILDFASNIYEPIDKLYDHFFEFDLRLFGIEPHLIYERICSSTISRTPKKLPKMRLHEKIKFQIYKAYRSHIRHSYLKKHAQEFYPCGLPETRTGNTIRMK